MTADALARLRRVWDRILSCRFHHDLYIEPNVAAPEQPVNAKRLRTAHAGVDSVVVLVDGEVRCPECTRPLQQRFPRARAPYALV